MSDVFTPTLAGAWKPTSTPPLLQGLFADLHRRFAVASGVEEQRPEAAALPDPYAWLTQYMRRYLVDGQGQLIPWAPRHAEFWEWVASIRPGVMTPAFIGVWPRGGGKSSSAELACAYLGAHGVRSYGLYISGTQEQADNHVGTVATMLESPELGIVRAVGKYGQSKGWRHNRLRTDRFTLDAVGLDSAARGVKIDEARPGLIIFDDLDDSDDSERVTLRKERALTRKILPSGSQDVAVLGIQNVPNANGIFARLVDGRADYLMDRLISGPFPALTDFAAERAEDAQGMPYFRITQGTPTWVGQDMAACQRLLNLIGLRAFEVESQHRTERLLGQMFKREWFTVADDWPRKARQVRFWDFAATEVTPGADPDFACGVRMAEVGGQYWIVDVKRTRSSPKGVEDLVRETAHDDGKAVEVWIEQEPGSSGKLVIDDYQRRVLKGHTVYGLRSTGSKPERAKPLSSATESGNVFVVAGKWNAAFFDEMEDFPEGAHDDQCDGSSGAQAVLATHRPAPVVLPHGTTHTSTWRA